MRRNQSLCFQIMLVCEAIDEPMPRLSYTDFENTSIDEFIEHCKLLHEEGSAEVQLVSGGVALVRLTAKGHDSLDTMRKQLERSRRKLGF